MRAWLRPVLRCLRQRQGVSAGEFALLAPILLTLAFGAVDLGRAFSLSMQLEEAAHSGTLYATSFPNDTTGITSVVNGNLTGITATVSVPATRCECSGAVVGCDTSCSAGMARYLTISISSTFNGYLYPRSRTLTGDATLRYQ